MTVISLNLIGVLLSNLINISSFSAFFIFSSTKDFLSNLDHF